MINPFIEKSRSIKKDHDLVAGAIKGDKKALEELIVRHQNWIYNIAFRMTAHPQDAEDVTQEILIKIITRLSTFRGESAFRTWLYRIVSNHVINMKKRKHEKSNISFDKYGMEIDRLPDMSLPEPKNIPVDLPLLVEETRVGCISGMLLCLSRERRLIFILGSIFRVNDRVGSEILNISRDNFRQKLSRGRRKISNFMNEKCSLMNKDNPCRCENKIGALIDEGFIDPSHLLFTRNGLMRVKAVARSKVNKIDHYVETKCEEIFREDPFQQSPDFVKSIEKLLSSDEVGNIFNLYN